MKKRGICLLPDACYLSELNVPGKPNRTNLGKCAAIQRFLSTHPNENLAILTPYRNQRALLAGTAKKKQLSARSQSDRPPCAGTRMGHLLIFLQRRKTALGFCDPGAVVSFTIPYFSNMPERLKQSIPRSRSVQPYLLWRSRKNRRSRCPSERQTGQR